MGALSSIVNTSAPSLYVSLFSITSNPTVWNIIARNEYRKRTTTRALGSPYHGCYLLAILIFTFRLVRDHLCQCALLDQPRVTLLPKLFATLVPVLIFIVGQVFVLTSTYTLGITGTDLTYVGGTLCFAATALWYERPTGLLITLYVYIVYLIALRYEG
ncbi:hypothetical protein PISMIDRAFT_31106 [Pisolithus microcarpus 441]|uniref:phosphatidyl-N-methylethanolamine N-methyltransferase n=1 Tax=Pisolithus microcarpus 441 TaxID=765257 RepID=A0A0C9YK96_9AGAM|nr:hypothetical protein BKA83DRAFT_31106 [Pisolithus microcarpus]KIK14279.1 hypothetical protein PISMIDRAFT_31106 [Pisolithus microcarpus 441]